MKKILISELEKSPFGIELKELKKLAEARINELPEKEVFIEEDYFEHDFELAMENLYLTGELEYITITIDRCCGTSFETMEKEKKLVRLIGMMVDV